MENPFLSLTASVPAPQKPEQQAVPEVKEEPKTSEEIKIAPASASADSEVLKQEPEIILPDINIPELKPQQVESPEVIQEVLEPEVKVVSEIIIDEKNIIDAKPAMVFSESVNVSPQISKQVEEDELKKKLESLFINVEEVPKKRGRKKKQDENKLNFAVEDIKNRSTETDKVIDTKNLKTDEIKKSVREETIRITGTCSLILNNLRNDAFVISDKLDI